MARLWPSSGAEPWAASSNIVLGPMGLMVETSPPLVETAKKVTPLKMKLISILSESDRIEIQLHFQRGGGLPMSGSTHAVPTTVAGPCALCVRLVVWVAAPF